MDSDMQALERRVWRRMAVENTGGDDLPPGAHLCARAAGILRSLSQRARGDRQEAFRHLAAEELETLAVLRGIQRFRCQKETETVVMNPPPEPEAALLRQCIQLQRELWIFFASRAAAPEFGPVYQALADGERRRLTQALALLGR